mmetsp:Transcript_38096/g.76344  ORF Transcript_38096/g.76344 Transcript_38096/m.76344 type:complete len:287 (-) Transcript_38096:283-1143(-)
MLYADKAALENRTKVKLLSIRERELTLYTNNCRTVGTVSALMAGIAYSALIYTKMAYFQESSTLQQFCYISGVVICMCLSLRNVLGTTMLTMLGPGKALRGPDGSMHSAVDGMLEAFEGIATVLHLTIWTFMLTTFFFSWGAASMSIISSVLLTVLLLGLGYMMYVQTTIVERTFPIRKIALVSGAFFPSGSKSAEREARVGAGTMCSASPSSSVAAAPPQSSQRWHSAGSAVAPRAQPSERSAMDARDGAHGHVTQQPQPPPPHPRGAPRHAGYEPVAAGRGDLL